MVNLTWRGSKCKVHKLHQKYILEKDMCIGIGFNPTTLRADPGVFTARPLRLHSHFSTESSL